MLGKINRVELMFIYSLVKIEFENEKENNLLVF